MGEFVAGEHLRHSQVANLQFFSLVHEDVEGLYIPVQDLVPVDVFQPHADLDEQPPDSFLLERPAILLLEEVAEVTRLAELHDDV